MLDVKRMAIETIASKRRIIIKRLHDPIRYLFSVVLIVDILIAFLYLNQLQLLLGIGILLGSILYVKFVSRARVFPVPKEIVVSVIFALGLFLFLIDENNASSPKLWISLLLLILLLTTNASLIAFWEINLDNAENQPSLATKNQIPYHWVISFSVLIGITGFFYFYIFFPINIGLALTFFTSGLGLFSLFLKKRSFPDALLFLGDLCLLSQ